MKYIFTSMLLLMIAMSKAQIVNIPDANFKAVLISMGIDANNDGEIQQSEANTVTDLQIPLSNQDTIKDLTGIRSFTNLEKLNCEWHNLRAIDVSGLAHLQELKYTSNITSLDVSNCTNLDGLNFAFFSDALEMLNAENCPRIKTLNFTLLSNSHPIDINLINCDSLVSMALGWAYIRTLNISQCDRIQSVTGVFSVMQILARNCLSLKEIKLLNGGGSFRSVDVTGCINLETLEMGEATTMDDIDLSTCPKIKTLIINAAMIVDHCLGVNLKNGTKMENCRVALIGSNTGLPICINICADDFEIDSASNWLHFVDGFGAELVNINSYCTFTPAASYNSIKGKVRLSPTSSCNNTSRVMPSVPVSIRDTTGLTVMKYSDYAGDYIHFFYTGEYTIKPYFAYPYFSINPTTATANFDTANSLVETRDFCITPNGIHNDLEITFLPTWPAARPGFEAAYTLVYKNRGTTTLSGNVSVNFDNSKMNFVTASENVTSQSTGQLVWAYNNLQPFESKSIYVSFNLLPPPVNNINDTIVYLASITPSANDETTFDNSFVLPQRIIGSYDPNDKECLEGSKLDIAKIGDYLHYIIHFQNEGTDTAFNIVVADTLSNKLDWSTFEFIKASHPVDAKLTNNKAEFIFKNIKLPYKAINEPASHGWVAFKIKPKPSVVIGDSLNNNAAIYFDFNMPVITNTATTIVSSSSTPVPVKLEYFSVNQKNNTNVLNWKASCSYGNATFIIERSQDGIHFSSIGNITATALRCQLPLNYTDNNPLVGKNYYRLKITDADGISFYSKILVIGNGKAGLQITAIANNSIYLNSNKQQTIQLKVIAADGREILSEKQIVAAGNNSINLQMKNAAKGIYTLIIFTNEGATINKRFIK